MPRAPAPRASSLEPLTKGQDFAVRRFRRGEACPSSGKIAYLAYRSVPQLQASLDILHHRSASVIRLRIIMSVLHYQTEQKQHAEDRHETNQREHVEAESERKAHAA